MSFQHRFVIGLNLVILVATLSNASVLSRKSRDVGARSQRETHLNAGHHIHVVSKRAPTLPAGQFNYMYVLLGGIVSSTPDSGGQNIQIAGTLAVSTLALKYAAYVVARMVTFMPAVIFKKLCASASVGIFDQYITVFPEYAYLAPTPACQGSCDGTCSQYCTFDGRPFQSLAGLGGSRAVDILDNLICTLSDPYFGTFSGLVHEFAHTVHDFGLSTQNQTLIASAYANATAKNTWDVTAYSMATVYEYFACGTGAYFNVDQSPESDSGNMNSCGSTTGATCATEKNARTWLQTHDPALFKILAYVYNNNKSPTLMLGGLTICPANPQYYY